MFLLHNECCFSILNEGVYFKAIADNAFFLEEQCPFGFVILCDLCRVKTIKGTAVILTSVEDC